MKGAKRTHFIILGILICCLGAIRFINLDYDPPPYNQCGVNVTDEPYYCLSGMNEFLRQEGRLIEDLQAGDKLIIFQHNFHTTLFGLKWFGATYKGLRVPITIFSLLIIVLLYNTITDVFSFSSPHWDYWLLLFLGLEYSLFVYSRYVTPQFYSLLWLSLALWIFRKERLGNIQFYLASLILSLAVVGVYPYLAFATLAMFCLVIFESGVRKSIWPVIYSGLGVISALCVIGVLMHLNGQTFRDYFDLISTVDSVKNSTGETMGMQQFVGLLLQIPFTNLFRYQPFLLLATVCSSVMVLLKFKRSHPILKFSVLSLIWAFVQSFFIASYPFKKWIILFPIVVILTIGLWNIIEGVKLTKLKKHGFAMLIVLIGVVGIKGILVNNDPIYWSSFKVDYPIVLLSHLKQGLLIMSTIVSIVVLIWALYVKKNVLVVGFMISVFLAGSFTIDYLVHSESRSRDTLRAFAPQVSNSVIAGEFSHAFAFYTNGYIAQNPYSLIFNQMDSAHVSAVLNEWRQDHEIVFLRKDLNGRKTDEHFEAFDLDFKLIRNDLYDLMTAD